MNIFAFFLGELYDADDDREFPFLSHTIIIFDLCFSFLHKPFFNSLFVDFPKTNIFCFVCPVFANVADHSVSQSVNLAIALKFRLVKPSSTTTTFGFKKERKKLQNQMMMMIIIINGGYLIFVFNYKTCPFCVRDF